jgi:Ca2+-binding RTX toxin-like protein
MAKITSYAQFNFAELEYLGKLLGDNLAHSFYDNQYTTSSNGKKYEDLFLLANEGIGGFYIADFKGKSIKYSKSYEGAPIIKGGTFQEFSSFAGDDYVPTLYIEDFNYSAKSFFDAALTEDRKDDLRVVQSIFNGNDTLILSDYSDKAKGYAGDDRIYGNDGDDECWGDDGNDTIYGDKGKDKLYGGNGSDSLLGGDETDILTGVALTDKNRGKSTIDILTGGNQNDTFVLGNSAGAFYSDSIRQTAGRSDYAFITDFTEGDVIQLKGKSSDYQIKSEKFTVNRKTYSGYGLYLNDGSNSKGWDSKDELISLIQTTNKLALGSESLMSSQGLFAYF